MIFVQVQLIICILAAHHQLRVWTKALEYLTEKWKWPSLQIVPGTDFIQKSLKNALKMHTRLAVAGEWT